MSRLVRAMLLFACLSTAACTLSVPRRDLPYPLTDETFGDPVKVVNIPLPVIKTDPNEGVTAGALSAFLLHDKKDEIRTMVVPQVNYNQNFGTTGRLFGAFYPAPGRRWEFTLAKSEHVNEDYTLKFRDRTLRNGSLDLNGLASFSADGSARFFGFQSSSVRRNETNYDDQETVLRSVAGFDLGHGLQLLVGDRLRDVDIKRGAFTSLPWIRNRFTPSQVPGIDGFTTHAQQLGLVYSTLDNLDMPTSGFYGRGITEVSARELGSTASFRHYTVELKYFKPLDDGRYVTAMRTAYEQAEGGTVPFLERASLGGKDLLRGYGENRFIDSSYLLFNVEERIRLFRYRVFNVNVDWEIAPFLDLGAVARNLLDMSAKNFVANPGIGFRAVVRPNIVGRVDVGYGTEGLAIFATLGYPF